MPEAVVYQNGKLLRRQLFDAPCLLSQLAQTLPQPCAGKGYCGKCRVQARGSLSRPTAAERAKLTAKELAAGYRLACQAAATGNVQLYLPQPAAPEKAPAAPVDAVRPLGSEYGFVLDLGTTTLSAALYHLPSGKLCGQCSMANPQIIYGADVLSRMERATQGDGERLSTLVRHALFDICASLLAGARLAPNDADAAVLVGNTAMLYLLFGHDTTPLCTAPFACDTRFGAFYPADFLPIKRGSQLYIPRCISAFLGADTTSAILGSALTRGGTRLLADLGTNGEMILHDAGSLYGCSCAAGPAFEGVGLSCGMPAVDGAVQTVMLSGGYYAFRTRGDTPPKGFCGSGIVDMIACMTRSGAMQRDGRINESDRFYLADTPLYLSQQDVRAFQLAKSAVRCGLETLCGRASHSVDSLALAGTFGNALHIPSAVQIGLIPPTLHNKTEAVGNAAGTGGAMLLLDRSKIAESEAIAERTETIPLAELPDFSDMLCRYTALE